MMQEANLLDNLKDIYLPKEVPFWPIAYGWWILLGLIIFIIICIFIFREIRKSIKRRKDLIIKDFRDKVFAQKPEEFVLAISVYLKRIAMDKFPKDNPHSLHGDKWLEYLDKRLKTKDFTTGSGKALLNSYAPRELNTQEQEELLAVAEKWLRTVI